MKIIFATNNPNKLKEIKNLMPKGIEIVSLQEIGCTEDIPETGDTLEANALEKAHYLKKHYGYDCFADDSGLEVEALNGAPGVYSARYAGAERSALANMTKLIEELKDITNRKAKFRTVVALLLNGEEHLFEGLVTGIISKTKHGTDGFGYDPIFFPDEHTKSFAQMSLSEKGLISHRGLAVRKLIAFLTQSIV